jgi:predicted RNase H-like HicB family nuclease
MKYIVVVEEGPESYGAYAPDLPGCAVIGESRGEVIKLIQEAIELHLQSLREHGDNIPPAMNGRCWKSNRP